MGILEELDRLNQPNAKPKTQVKQPCAGNAGSSSEAFPDDVAGPSYQVQTGYEHMSLKDLQGQVSKYGFRPGNRRSLLLKQLDDVRRALEDQCDQDTSFSSSIFSSSPPQQHQSSPERRRDSLTRQNEAALSQRRSTSTDRHHVVETEEIATIGSDEDDASGSASGDTSDEEVLRSGRPSLTKRMSAGAAKANETPLGSVPAAVAKQLLEAVRSDRDVYRRILQFEPISFDEISSLAKRANVQGLRNKEMLRNWLDVQCICFYTAELTGQRQRY